MPKRMLFRTVWATLSELPPKFEVAYARVWVAPLYASKMQQN